MSLKLAVCAFLVVLVRHSLVAAAGSGDGHSETGVYPQCVKLEEPSSKCVHTSDKDQYVFANEQHLVPGIFDAVSQTRDEGSLSQICVGFLTAMACYFTYPPCHSARGIHQLPMCLEQCRELKQSLVQCSSNFEALVKLTNQTGVPSPLTELLQFTTELNCTQPDSFQVSSLPVDQEACVNWTLYLLPDNQESNNRSLQLPEIVVIYLGSVFLFLVIVLLLVIVVAVIVCVRRRKRHSLSKVACNQPSSNGTTLRRLDSPNPTAVLEKFASEEDVDVRSDVHVARKLTDRKRRQYVSLYTGSFIPYQHLELHNVIGEGAFGKVTEGVWRDPATTIERRVAIKTLRSFSSEQQLNTLFTESRAMRDFDHPNVMKFYGMCFDAPEGYPYIILPFMTNGSLLDYLKRNATHSNTTSGYPEGLLLDVLFQFCLDIAEGMTYLVQQKFVHRDLAARNCMVSETKSILIGDFGLAEDLYSKGQKQSDARLPVKWMPPESLRDGVSNERTDMWSYGVTCWEVFSLGRSPYPGIENHEVLQHISNGGRLKKPTLCPDKLYEIVCGCWQYNPRDRPSFHDMTCTLQQYWNISQQPLPS